MTPRHVQGRGDYQNEEPDLQACTFPLQPSLDGIALGFRLAHGRREFEETRGRCWDSHVVHPEWSLNLPTQTGENVGFRLAWERS